MRRQVITNNTAEFLDIVNDGERYGILQTDPHRKKVAYIILNPKEAQAIAKFIAGGNKNAD